MPNRRSRRSAGPLLTAVGVTAVLALAASGCGSGSDSARDTPDDAGPGLRVEQLAASAPPPSSTAVAGCDGTWITPGRPAQRVLSLRNYVTELLVGLGAADQVVGQVNAGSFTPLPQLARAYARVPVLATRAPSQEQVLAARPDLVVGDGSWAFDGKGVPTQKELVASGVAPYVIPPACLDARHPSPRLDDAFRTIEDLGRLTGTETQATALAGWGRERIAETQRSLPAAARPTVLAGGVSEGAFYAYDRGFYAPTLNAIRLDNVLPRGTVTGTATFAPVSVEQVLRWNPDALVLTYLTEEDLTTQREYVRRRLGRLTAVRADRVSYVPESFFAGGLGALARLPEVAFAARGQAVPASLRDARPPVG